MREIKDIWFKHKSPARNWLEKNLDLEKSFSETFRTTGGTFSYYEYEFILNGCVIQDCKTQAVGSFSTNGGSRLALCEMHVLTLMNLQAPQQSTASIIFLVTTHIPKLVGLLLSHPLVSLIRELSVMSLITSVNLL